MDAGHDPDGAADKLDGLGGPAPEPENAVLVDTAQVVRWAGPAFLLCSLALIPWTIYLGFSLPERQISPHYDIAWVGFDLMLAITLGGTGYFALRRSRYLAVFAAAAATLLAVDAWFDIMTSPRDQIMQAVILAAVIELPLAAVCVWLSYHTEHLAQRRIILLMRRASRRP